MPIVAQARSGGVLCAIAARRGTQPLPGERAPTAPGRRAALPELDHANGARYRAMCQAMRPDPQAKEQAWTSVISGTVTGRLAEGTAQGVWVAGQERLMAGYRSRYFGEALHALAGMSSWAQERLGRLLFPSTLCDAATVAAAQAALASTALRRTCPTRR